MSNYTINGDVINQCEKSVVSKNANNFTAVVNSTVSCDDLISNDNSNEYVNVKSISLKGGCVPIGLYI